MCLLDLAELVAQDAGGVVCHLPSLPCGGTRAPEKAGSVACGAAWVWVRRLHLI